MAAIVAVGYNWLKTGDGRHAMELFQKADRGKAPENRGAHGGLWRSEDGVYRRELLSG